MDHARLPAVGGGALEDELRRTRALLESVLDGSPDAIVSFDRSGWVALWNSAAERMTGYGAAEALAGLDVQRLHADAVARVVLAAARRAEAGAIAGAVRAEVVARSGEAIPVSLSLSALGDAAGGGCIAAYVDLRERVTIERRLQSAEQRLRESEDQAMIAALAGAAAHELNQPLTSVMGYADLLRRKIPPADPGYRPIDIIYREAERMAEIVRKIGRITRYETTDYVGKVRIVDLGKATGE